MQTPNPKQGSNRNLMIGIVIASLLCCCLVVTAAGGYFGYKAYLTAQAAKNAMQDFQLPTDPSNPDQPIIPIPGIPGFGSGDLPQGGLTDDVTRATAWGSLLVTGSIYGCESATVEGTTIEVVSQPDANGKWVEKWNTPCGDGTNKSFTITFTPQNGITGVDIAPPQ